MSDPRNRDPEWMQQQLIHDNDTPGRVVWSARFEMPSAAAAEAAKSVLTVYGASRADADGASHQIVVEFKPALVHVVAETVVAYGGTLCVRHPSI